jgi:ATP-dependent protease ClpP protease subunit
MTGIEAAWSQGKRLRSISAALRTTDCALLVYIGGEINDRLAGDVRDILRRDRYAPVFASFSSEGGSAGAGLDIYKILRGHIGDVTAFVPARQRCCSAAMVAYLGGDERIAAPDAHFYWHDAVLDAGHAGRTTEHMLRCDLATLEITNNRMANIFAQRTGIALSAAEEELDLSASDAVEYGVVHRIER